MASGRDLGDLSKKVEWIGKDYTPHEIARKYDNNDVVALLERFTANPVLTRDQIQ